MMIGIFSRPFAIAAAIAMTACASVYGGDADEAREPSWAGIGYLTPGPTSEPELVGRFLTKTECEAAIHDWMSRQVVGNPVFAECLPIDLN